MFGSSKSWGLNSTHCFGTYVPVEEPSTASEANSPAAPMKWLKGNFLHVRFSNRPFGVKHFQTIHHYSVDVAHGLVLLFGIGTKALPSWDSKTRRNNLWDGLAVRGR
jgi:hypothetical protein